MSPLVRNIIWDVSVTWSLIYFGLYLKIVDFQGLNIQTTAEVLLLTFAVINIIASLCFNTDDRKKVNDFMERTGYPRSKVHVRYQTISSFVEIVVIIASGFVWIGVIKLISDTLIYTKHEDMERNYHD